MATPKTALEQLGFTRADKDYKVRKVIISAEGLEKEGKTHFALTSPQPIIYMDIDIGGDKVLNDFTKMGKEIYHEKFSLPRAATISNKAEVKAHATPLWNRFLKRYFDALESSKQKGGARTIIIDTATDFWNLCLLANVGKDRQIMPQERTQANALFSEVIRSAFGKEYNANVILIHKMGKEFDNPTNLERKGFNQIGFLVSIVVQCSKKKNLQLKRNEFFYKITTCRPDTNLEGEVYPAKHYNFPKLMAEIHDGTEVEDWE